MKYFRVQSISKCSAFFFFSQVRKQGKNSGNSFRFAMFLESLFRSRFTVI
uniref:Uncharacterized protein n=1 Tax=Arundo donax TaxID=35708 RepID=A0A0A9SJC8_ARUDO